MSKIVIDVVDRHSSSDGFDLGVCGGDGDGVVVLVLLVAMLWC